MATTCELIAKNVLGSSASSVTFSSIPSTYTDLALVMSVRGAGAGDILIRFNGSSTNYTHRHLRGRGSSGVDSFTEGAFPAFTNTYLQCGYASSATSTFSSSEIYIPNYAGSTNKSTSCTTVQEANASVAQMQAIAGLWSNTAAITSIAISLYLDTIAADSSFFLYGITKS